MNAHHAPAQGVRPFRDMIPTPVQSFLSAALSALPALPVLPMLSILLVAGCAVGPDYDRPAPPATPTEWNAAKTRPEISPGVSGDAGRNTTVPAAPDGSGATRATVSASTPDGQWWERMGDPLLSELVATAVGHNNDALIAAANLREARAVVGVARGALLPEAAAGGSYERSRVSSNTLTGQSLEMANMPVENDLYQAGFDARWEIDIFGGARRGVEAARARQQAAEAGLSDVLLSVAAETARAYVELRGAQARLDVAERNADAQRRTLELVRLRRDVGVASDMNVLQAEAQLRRTEALVPPLRASTDASIHRLGVLCGQPPAALRDRLAPRTPLPSVPDLVPVGLPSDLLLRRPDIRRVEHELHAATADIGQREADLFPKFSLTGSYGLNSIHFSDLFRDDSRAWTIMPGVRWAIFEGGRTRAAVAALEARREATLERWRKTVLVAFEEVETSLARYAESFVERERLSRSLEAQAEATRLAKVRYAEGVDDLLTVLDAERRQLEVEEALARSRSGVLLQLVSLYKSLGGGWVEGIAGAGPDAGADPAVAPTGSEASGAASVTRTAGQAPRQ
ncbi:MAG: efflux transporter outer membrane subunit [Desulfovibrio sp.]|nr:efflux transporter outer membrane subunit [Desulfovibrio sp.]